MTDSERKRETAREGEKTNRETEKGRGQRQDKQREREREREMMRKEHIEQQINKPLDFN